MSARAARQHLEPRGLSREEAAAYVGVGTTLFDELVAARKMPASFHINTRVLWDRWKLDLAIDALQELDASPRARWRDVG